MIYSNRPHVNIPIESRLDDLLQALNDKLESFKQFNGIAGIMLDGGMSRGFADELSETDVVLFLHQDAYVQYQSVKTPVALGITAMDGYLYDPFDELQQLFP